MRVRSHAKAKAHLDCEGVDILALHIKADQPRDTVELRLNR
jgi:hypothetical protein